LIIVADGVGVGDGDGEGEGVGVGEAVGVGVGVGVGVTCACAEDTPMASTKTTQASRANARPAPILSVRDAQRMNSIPEKSARSKNCAKKITPRGSDLGPVHAMRQSVTVVAKD
jgi:hypothetical protein